MRDQMAPEMINHNDQTPADVSSETLTISPNLDASNTVVSEVEPTGAVAQTTNSIMPSSKGMSRDVNEDVEVAAMHSEPPYSVFSTTEKRLTLIMAALSAFISPLSSTIYLPALNTLAQHYQVSNSLINLTVTTYLIFQGIGPTIFGDLADQAGRRPAYLTAFTIYLAANIALALQNSYPALLVLRMLQSTGASASTVICMGVIADLTVTNERGKYLGLVTAGTMFGPAISPVIGGLLAQFLGWRSIFWFLVIAVSIFLIPFTIFVPETCRKMVGNGSIPARGWNVSFLRFLKDRRPRKALPQREKVVAKEKKKTRFPNPLLSLKLILEKDVAIILIFNGICYMSFTIMTTSIPSLFRAIYGFNDLVIGVCYLPFAFGGILSSIGIGRCLDINYRRIAKKRNFPIDYKRGNDLRNYPIELARIQPLLPLLTLGILTSISYGWALTHNPPLAVSLILQFILGFCYTGILTISTTLLVDLYPISPSTVSATNNLIRCSLGALSTAVLNPMLESIGRGWTFTFFALLAGGLSPGLWVLVRWGPGWREERRVRVERRMMKN